MSRSQKSVPMFFKFLAGCLLLAFLLIIGGGMVVHFQTQLRSRGNYLKPPFKHYLEYQQEMGRAVVAVADVVSGEPSLRRALAEYRSDDAGASAAEASPDDADPSGVTEAAPRTASPAALASDIFERLRSKHSIQPDLMLVVDDQGGHVWSRIIGEAAIDGRVGAFDPQDMGDMEAVNRVRSGATLRNTVLIHNGRAYQIAGVPVRAPGARQIVGGLLIGTALDRYMDQFESHSDPDRPLQLRLVLIAQGQVVAASVPPSVWTELAQNLSRTPDSWSYAHDRGTYRQRIIKLQRGDASDELLAGSYDVYGARDGQDPDSDMALVRGFDGLVAGEVGELYMLRSRDDVSRRRPTIPWTEGLIGIALSCGVAFLLAMWITRPIQDFVRQTRQLLAGETNLTQRIEIRSRDETQALAQNINKAFERLYRLATEVHSAAFQVGASSAEMSAASKQMLGGLKDQTEKIASSTAAVTELSASIQQVAENAAEATTAAEKSNQAVGAAVSRMEEIRASVEEAATRMQELGESSKRIGNIVEVIRQISEQTSLLALNASIEAAHAGEQGRGFAVVADEVSSLARRVGQSAKDIETLIQTIKEQTTEAISSMQLGTREVEEGTSLVTATLTDLSNLIEVVKDTASAVQEQAVVSDEIARNMDAVQGIASEVLSGSEESVVQAEQLQELAFALEQSVGGFNLDSGRAAPATDGDPATRLAVAGHLPAPRTGRADS